MNVDYKMIRGEIEKVVGLGPALQATSTKPPFTPRVKKALAIAIREAKASHHAGVGAGHIFLGLLMEGGGVAALVLKNLGVNVQTAREEILRELGGC
jgi:ATP-dependent Clp protease ATP-binding subunit ClpC